MFIHQGSRLQVVAVQTHVSKAETQYASFGSELTQPRRRSCVRTSRRYRCTGAPAGGRPNFQAVQAHRRTDLG